MIQIIEPSSSVIETTNRQTMEFAKATAVNIAEPDSEGFEVKFPIESLLESPPWKRPKLDDPDTTTIPTESTDAKESHKVEEKPIPICEDESTDVKESHNAEEKPIYVREYPDFHAGAESTDAKGSHKAEVKPIPRWVRRFDENYPDGLVAGYSDRPSYWRCPICNRAGHNNVRCPERQKHLRPWCFECLGTCQKVDDHCNYAYIKRLMNCTVCRVLGKHWTNECPNLKTYCNDSDDSEYGDIDHGYDFGDSSLETETDDSDDSEGF